MHPQWCSVLTRIRKKKGCDVLHALDRDTRQGPWIFQSARVLPDEGFLRLVKTADRLLKEMRDLGQLRSDLHIEGIRSALIGMMEGLLRDRMMASSIAYSASYNGEDIRKLFLHVLNSFSAT